MEEMYLVPNCSEYVFRINAKDLSKEQIEEIEKVVEDLQNGNYNPMEWFGEDEIDENGKPYNIEIYANQSIMFGIPNIKVSGESGDHGEFFRNWLETKGYEYEEGD